MLDRQDYLYFTERALDGMTSIVRGLGDDLANRKPSLEGANSPFALLTHCVGVIDYWVGYLIAGRHTDRDREAEFLASGPIQPLLLEVRSTKAQLIEDVLNAEPEAPLRSVPPADFQGPDRTLTQGGALQHVFEELAQHHGQMELMRDVIVAEHAGHLITVNNAVRS
ncbi:DinB family protein [Paenarthrobacter nitroguajacolicus]|uniref:DinB family protein n=1 Tax=Paenarthrobacter nitroguajacolicus TaxID=211146 RepID=A0A558HCM8_PAENT|nr:DinB family protein [Paenarthrobacter nitroguajacolicus]TVU66844.1 DinB family protein [Paenarthrobacter nitroguajacolicus]